MNGGGLFRPRLVFSSRRQGRAQERSRDSDRAEQFRLLILPHMDAAYTLARYLTRDPSAAEDIVQDAFLRAFRSFEGWRGDSPKAWLLAIVRNCFLTSVGRGRDPAVPVADIDPLATVLYPDANGQQDPEAIVMARREAIMLRSTVENLPEPFREALVLRELQELSYKEIATITHVPIGTVMSRLARARQMLAQLLMPDADAFTGVQP
jgi:RNA polymerase sigma-70 factor (ECF subfamily)